MYTVWYDYSLVETDNGTAIALGNFDGLHKGHMKLMNMLSKVALEHNLPTLAYTFSKHPINVIKGEGTLALVADNEAKHELVSKSCAINTLFFENFEKIKDLDPEEFIKNILVDKLNMKIAIVGKHNHYGKDSKGDVKLLRELGQKYGFMVHMIEPYCENGVVCSSTKIREYIQNGEIEKANEFLARPFRISNEVVKDKMIGRTLGFPTANMIPGKEILLPKFGTYATNATVDNITYKSITNVGINPTIGDGLIRIETHILDFDQEIYGKTIDVDFLYRMRDSVLFGSLDTLKEQLGKDKKRRQEDNQ